MQLVQGQSEPSVGFEMESASLSLRDGEPCGCRLGGAGSHFHQVGERMSPVCEEMQSPETWVKPRGRGGSPGGGNCVGLGPLAPHVKAGLLMADPGLWSQQIQIPVLKSHF